MDANDLARYDRMMRGPAKPKVHMSRFGYTALCGKRINPDNIVARKTGADPRVTCATCKRANVGKNWLF